MPSPPLSSIRIFLLGRFEVVRGDRTLSASDWTRRKAQTLLARLALEPSRRLLKDQALDLLWPDQPAASASNNLYRTLHALRQTLDAHLGPGSAEAIFSFEDGVLMLAESVWIDVAEFERLCSNLQLPTSNLQSRISNLQTALSLYPGDLLPDDLYAEWTIAPRESLRRLHREARLAVAKHHIAEREYTAAIELLTPLLNRDRADEPVHRELMRAYALAEMYRVLKPGGRLQIADIALQKPVSENAASDVSLWTGCIAGGLLKAILEKTVKAAGFKDVEVIWGEDVFSGAPQSSSAAQFGTLGVHIRGRK